MSLDICFIENDVEVFSANITHNLAKMAEEAGIYETLWHPSFNGITKASEMLPILLDGLILMAKDKEYFEAFNAENGWGTYSSFLPWILKVVKACIEYPNAEVFTSV